MCTTLTEMSMHEACSVPACEAFRSEKKKKREANYGHKLKTWETEHPETTWGHRCRKMETCSNCKECDEKRQRERKKRHVFRERMWHMSKREENKRAHTQLGADHWAAPRPKRNISLQTVEKTAVCSNWGLVVAERLSETSARFPPPFLSK